MPAAEDPSDRAPIAKVVHAMNNQVGVLMTNLSALGDYARALLAQHFTNPSQPAPLPRGRRGAGATRRGR